MVAILACLPVWRTGPEEVTGDLSGGERWFFMAIPFLSHSKWLQDHLQMDSMVLHVAAGAIGWIVGSCPPQPVSPIEFKVPLILGEEGGPQSHADAHQAFRSLC